MGRGKTMMIADLPQHRHSSHVVCSAGRTHGVCTHATCPLPRSCPGVTEDADAGGRGAFRVDGEMVDTPLIAQAERVLDRTRKAGKR